MRGVWLLLLLTGCCSAQQGEYVLAGSVVNSRTGEPLKRALVTAIRLDSLEEPADASASRPLRGVRRSSIATLTDASGAFHFTGVAGGTYGLSVVKPHFTDLATQREPVGIKSSGKEDVRLELSPLAVIEGKITDQRGQPVSGASVVVIQTNIVDGRRQTQSSYSASSDDRGIFRAWDIAPGRYLIKAAGSGGTYTYLDQTGVSNGGFLEFVPVYFGGPTADSATPVVIEPGTDAHADIVVSLQPAHKVRGALASFGTGNIEFALLSDGEDVGSGRVNFSRARGTFEMLEIVNGSYILRAMEGNEAIAELPIVVDGADLNGLRMTLAGPVEIPVNLHMLNQPEAKPAQTSMEGQPSQENQAEPSPPDVRFCMPILDTEANARPNWAIPTENGSIRALPGRYRVRVLCGNAYVVSATLGNADLLASPQITVVPGATPAPIEIVARHGGGTIAGTLKLDQAPAGETLSVLLVPQVSTREPVMSPVPSQSGSQFLFDSLAPGDYTLYAFSTDQIEYRNPEFLRGLTGGDSVHVEDGGSATAIITRLVQ